MHCYVSTPIVIISSQTPAMTIERCQLSHHQLVSVQAQVLCNQNWPEIFFSELRRRFQRILIHIQPRWSWWWRSLYKSRNGSIEGRLHIGFWPCQLRLSFGQISCIRKSTQRRFLLFCIHYLSHWQIVARTFYEGSEDWQSNNRHWVPIDWVNIINDSKYWHNLYNQNKQSSTACLKTTFCKNTPSNMLVNSQHPVKHGGDVLRPYILRCEGTPTHLFSLSVSFLKRLENDTRLQKCLLSLKVTLPPARQKMQMWSHS